MSSDRKTIEALVATAVEAGWRVQERTHPGHGKNKQTRHWRLVPPDSDGKIITAPRTPSDHRAVKNFRADLRRQGLDV